MIATPPFRAPFGPVTSVMGSPGVAATNRSNASTGFMTLSASTDPRAPSRASVLVSILAFDLDRPRHENGASFVERFLIGTARATFGVGFSRFTTSGIFAGALTSAVMRIFVEEFRGSAFIGASRGPDLVLLRRSPSYVGGSDVYPALPSTGRGVSHQFSAAANYRYRVFVDLEIEVRGEGFGTFGGSSSSASLAGFLSLASVDFRRASLGEISGG